ncbi:MAG: hypothetical protein ACP5KY_05450 [Thermoproteus sp.]
MWWRKWAMGWGGGWWWRGPPVWGPTYDEWLDLHLRAAVWQIRGLAQFVKENAGRLDPQSREALAKELEELARELRRQQ